VEDRGPYPRLASPAFHIGGWYDIFLHGTLRNFVGLRGGACQRLVIGPWSDGIPWLANPVGAVDFGYASTAVSLGLDDMQLRWCDHWLQGVDDGVLEEPPVRIFVMGESAWRDGTSGRSPARGGRTISSTAAVG
jgi:putative CocE/NonD family hydrolase